MPPIEGGAAFVQLGPARLERRLARLKLRCEAAYESTLLSQRHRRRIHLHTCTSLQHRRSGRFRRHVRRWLRDGRRWRCRLGGCSQLGGEVSRLLALLTKLIAHRNQTDRKRRATQPRLVWQLCRWREGVRCAVGRPWSRCRCFGRGDARGVGGSVRSGRTRTLCARLLERDALGGASLRELRCDACVLTELLLCAVELMRELIDTCRLLVLTVLRGSLCGSQHCHTLMQLVQFNL